MVGHHRRGITYLYFCIVGHHHGIIYTSIEERGEVGGQRTEKVQWRWRKVECRILRWFYYITSIVEYSRGGSIAGDCQESIVEGGRDVLVRKMTRRRQQPRLLHSGAS